MPSARPIAILGTVALFTVGYGLTWVNHCPAQDQRFKISPPVRGLGELKIGAAQTPLRPRLPVALAGYRPLRPDANDFKRPLFARATAVQIGNARLGILSLELFLIPESLANQLRNSAKTLGYSDLVVAATHTHSSFGGYDPRSLFEAAATGSFRQDVADELLAASESALKAALASLQPAAMKWAQRDFPELAVARSEGMAPKGRLTRVQFVNAEGKPVAQWIFLGAHPTTVPKNIPLLDGDWAGALALSEESAAQGVTSVFQSAGGNASAATFDAAPEDKAQRISEEVAKDLEKMNSTVVASTSMIFVRKSVTVPPLDVHRAVPLPLRGAASNWACRDLPLHVDLSLLALGDQKFLFVPGEPTQGAATELEKAAQGALEVSLSDGYLGYVERPEQIERKQGESKRQYFDASLLPSLTKAAGELNGEARR